MATITDGIRDGFPAGYPAAGSDGQLCVAMGAIGRIATMLLVWHERARERRRLLALDERALQDFGRSFTDARSEGDKPFWRA